MSRSGVDFYPESEEDEHRPIMELDVPFQDVKDEVYDVIFAHPEALLCTEKGEELLDSAFTDDVLAIVVDECHTVDQWAKSFRKAFGEIKTLTTFCRNAKLIGLSGTLTTEQLKTVPSILGMQHGHIVVEENPDRPNIFLEKVKRKSNQDVITAWEEIFLPECKTLKLQGPSYPVTLMYMPLQYCDQGQKECIALHGGREKVNLSNATFSIIFSRQDQMVTETVLRELKKEDPRFRLVFCSSSLGMGFDSPSVERIIHGKPPRNLSDYLQQIGRAGRSGQPSRALLYWNGSDISKNIKGLNDNMVEYCKEESKCLRLTLLKAFGFTSPKEVLRKCQCCSNCSRECVCDTCVNGSSDMAEV